MGNKIGMSESYFGFCIKDNIKVHHGRRELEKYLADNKLNTRYLTFKTEQAAWDFAEGCGVLQSISDKIDVAEFSALYF